MGMARKNPTLEAIPARQVDGVGIVTENENGTTRINLGQRLSGAKLPSPEVIHAHNLQPCHISDFVSQDLYARRAKDCCQPVCDLRLSPTWAVIMVTKYAHCSDAAL